MPKFASFNKADTPPRLVRGWWDTDAHDYGDLPAEDSRYELTDDVWDQLVADLGPHLWQIDVDGKVTVYVPPPLPPATYDVPKLVLTNRLVAAGLLRTALGALKTDAALAELSDNELVLRERFMSARVFSNADQQVRQFLLAIGGDVETLLAPPPAGS